jgi:hypothetical protein
MMTAKQTSSMTFTPFNNDDAASMAWPRFEKEIWNTAFMCLPQRQYGLVDQFFSRGAIAQRIKIPIDEAALLPLLKHPGNPPDEDDAMSAYDKRLSMYLTQQNTKNAIIHAMYAALGPVQRRMVDPDDEGEHQIVPKASMDTLREAYGKLSRTDRKGLEDQLKVTFQPGTQDPHTLLSNHAAIYKRLSEGAALKQDCDKIDFLLDVLGPCGLFIMPIERFLQENPDSEDQKYDTLVKQITDFLKTHPVGATTGTAGYAGLTQSVTAPRTGPAPRQSMEDIEARIYERMENIFESQQLALLTTLAQPNTPVSGVQRTQTLELPRQYGWTHGWVKHNSMECTKRKTGHKETATLNNRKGGSDRFC